MKRLLLIFFVCTNLHLYADDYKILQINTSSIKIGEVLCKQGDIFSDEARIFWSNDKQAFKAMNMKTKQIKLFVSRDFNHFKAKNIKEYYIKNNHLSTRGALISFSDLEEELSDTIFILDTIPIESPVYIDSLSSFIISYVDGEKTKWCTLMSNEDNFFLSRELFTEDNTDGKYTLTLYYRRKGLEDYLITDKLYVVLLPQQIEE